jgi:hypothetical protein
VRPGFALGGRGPAVFFTEPSEDSRFLLARHPRGRSKE